MKESNKDKTLMLRAFLDEVKGLEFAIIDPNGNRLFAVHGYENDAIFESNKLRLCNPDPVTKECHWAYVLNPAKFTISDVLDHVYIKGSVEDPRCIYFKKKDGE